MRTFTIIFVIAVLGFVAFNVWSSTAEEKSAKNYEIAKSDAEWKEKLSPKAYRVLRHHDTERPHTSPLNKNKKEGIYKCAGCDLPLFSSDHKYDSGTGWPSFFRPLNDTALGSKVDYKLVLARTEVHCSRCGGHLGHVFSDGPRPTGKRYCINGVSLSFDQK